MAIRSKEYLRNAFRTGAIPTGEDFADLIQTIISQINDKYADDEGVVRTDFQIIEPLGPDAPPSAYPNGSSEFYIDYDPSDYEEYIEENPSFEQLEAGKLAVRTFRNNGFSIQQVDNVKNDLFEAAYVRVNIDNSTWGPLSVVGTTSNVVGYEYNLYTHTPPSGSSPTTEFEIEVPDLDMDKDILIPYISGMSFVPNVSIEYTYNNPTLQVTLLDGWFTSIAYTFNLQVLKQKPQTLKDIPDASTTEKGLVKVDGTTITATDGVISAVASGLPLVHFEQISPTTTITQLKQGITLTNLYMGSPNAIKQAWVDYLNLFPNIQVGYELEGIEVITFKNIGTATQVINVYDNAFDGDKGYPYLKFTRSNQDGVWQSLYRDVSYTDFEHHITTLGSVSTPGHVRVDGNTIKQIGGVIYVPESSVNQSGVVKVDGTTITANDGTISVPTASLTSRGVVQLYNSITSNSTVAATPSAVNSAIIAHSDVMSSATVLGHVKVDGTTITSADGVISATSATIPDATTTVKGKVQLASSVNNATNLATTPAAVQNAINAHVSIIPTTSIRGHVKSDGVSTAIDAAGTMKAKTKLNRIWDSRPITENATTWTVDFSDEEELTDLNEYWFEVYDDGVLVFGNPITHTVNNANKTVTFTPQTPMSRPFTITCIGRGMEFPQ